MSVRLRIFAVAFSVSWGIYFFHAVVHLPWSEALTLAATAGGSYALDPTSPRQRLTLVLTVGAFMALGAWWAVGLGSLSILVGVVAAGSLVVYLRIVARRTDATPRGR
jgi:hypothetical protein